MLAHRQFVPRSELVSRYQSILETVGNTPVVRINRLAPKGVNLWAKVEAFNPLGSVKDRLALGIIEAAEKSGQLKPGQTVIGADSHSSSHGGLGAFSIGLGGADVCVAMVLGETWIQVPEAIQVSYDGKLPFGLTGKDVILKTLGELAKHER